MSVSPTAQSQASLDTIIHRILLVAENTWTCKQYHHRGDWRVLLHPRPVFFSVRMGSRAKRLIWRPRCGLSILKEK